MTGNDDSLAFDPGRLWYIKTRGETDKRPKESWGGYSQGFDAAEHVYTHDEVVEQQMDYWGIVGVQDIPHTSLALLIFDLDVYKAPESFDPDDVTIPADTLVVRSLNGGLHVYFIVHSERGAGSESDFTMTESLGWDIDIRGSYVKQHVVAPNDIPGVRGEYEVVNDAPITVVTDPSDAAERVRYDDEPLLEYDAETGVGTFEFEHDTEPPEDMPRCYQRGLELRAAAPDDHPNTHKVNTLTALCGLAAGYDIDAMISHFIEEYPPGEPSNADREVTEYQLTHMAKKVRDGSLAPPAVSTLRDWGILDDGETCDCLISYHGGTGGEGIRVATDGGSADTDLPQPDEFDVLNGDGGYAKWIPTDDDEGYYDVITNFQIQTVSRLTTDDGDREFHLWIHPAAEGEDPYEVTCDPVVFNDIRKFRRQLLDGWTVTFDGSQAHLNRLKEFVGQQEAQQRRGTKLLGLHGDEWVTPDGALTADGWADDPDTVFTDVDTPLANAFSLTPADSDDYDETAVRDILRLLPETRTPERFIPVLGWFYATPFRPYIQEWEGEFNLLNILGDTGSGKTTTLELLWRLFGVDEELPEAKATPFSIMRIIASSNALPVILDEYKPAEIRDYKLDELHNNLRTSTRGGVVTKGRSDMGVDTYHLNAPVCVSGEQPIQGPAEERRTILTVFKRDVTVGETPEQRAYARLVGGEAAGDWFDGLPLEQHALAYYRWVLQQEKADLHQLWQDCRAAVIDLLDDRGHSGLDDMVIQGFQTIKFGCSLYRDFASTMGLDPETTPITADNIDAAIAYVAAGGTGADHVSHLDRLLAVATRAARAGYLIEEEHYKIVRPGEPNAELRIHLPTAFDKVRKYAREHDVRSDDLLGSAHDYTARIKDAADDPEHYVITHSQNTPPLSRCVGIHIGDAADVIDGFEPQAFGLDRHLNDDGEPEPDSRFETTPLLDVASDPTGYPTVTGELATVELPENDDAPAVTATLTNGSAAIDVIAWDDDPGLASLTGERVIIDNAAVAEFDGQTQLVYKPGVTTIHEAPDDDQAQLGASA